MRNWARPFSEKSTKSVSLSLSRTPSNKFCFNTKPDAIFSSIEFLVIKLMTVKLLLSCPSRSILPSLWFFLAGFQGNSKLTTVSATCRLRPEPPASVERKTLQSELSSNFWMSFPRCFTGICPLNWANPTLFSCNIFPIRLFMRTHSEKIIIFLPLVLMSNFSNRISFNSSNFGE